jgi:PPP family 3-phenylpropionic acid transporter
VTQKGGSAGISARLPGTIWASAFYFTYLAAIGATAPFIYLVYRQHGLTEAEIGIVIAVAHVMNFLTAPTWGAASDILHRRNGFSLLPIACLGSGVAILILPLVRGLFPTLAAVVLWGFFAGSIISLGDAATLNMLAENRHAYGRVRMWGSVGGVLASLIVGQLGNRLGLGVIFPAYTLLLILCGTIALRIPSGAIQSAQDQLHASAGKRKTAVLEDFFHLLRRSRFGIFLTAIGIYCIAYMGWRSTFSFFLEDLGGSPGLIGSFFALSALVEIPVAASSSRWLSRFGVRNALVGSFMIFSLLWLGCSLLVKPGLALLLAVVHGLAFALVEIAGVVYVNELVSPDSANLAQGAYGGVNRGLGSILGSLWGGAQYTRSGGSILYRISALVVLAALGCLLLLSGRGKRNLAYSESGPGQAGIS